MEDINWRANYKPWIKQYSLVHAFNHHKENVISGGHHGERGFNGVFMDVKQVFRLQGYMTIVFEEEH